MKYVIWRADKVSVLLRN